MNLIEQRSNVWGETPYTKEEAILWIERAGRVCYRSEDKIVEGSGLKFVENIWKRKHLSVIEHSNLVLRTREKSAYPLISLNIERSVYNSKFLSHYIHEDRVYVGGNWRAWIEWYSSMCQDEMTLGNITEVLDSDLYEVVTDPEKVPNQLKMITVEFITDRAVTHEMVRHRPASYSQESQRYVRYGDIKFIRPSWYKDDEESYEKELFLDNCYEIEKDYKQMLTYGLKAEDARVILPNCTATKIIMTASIPEWKHVFKLRTSKAAYPQIRHLMNPVKERFMNEEWL